MVLNRNPNVIQRIKALLDLKGEGVSPQVAEPIQLVLDVTPKEESDTVIVTDGTDNMAVNTDGSINVDFVQNRPLKVGTGQTAKFAGNGKAGTAVTAGTGITLLTPTATKTFYMTSLFVIAGSQYEIRDGSGGTLIMSSDTTQLTQITFPTPIPISTGVFLDTLANSTAFYHVSGWEE